MPHGKVNVTKYELPTLLGSGKNESLYTPVLVHRAKGTLRKHGVFIDEFGKVLAGRDT